MTLKQKKIVRITVTAVLLACAIGFTRLLHIDANYDAQEPLLDVATRAIASVCWAYPDKDSPELQAALKELYDIVRLDVPDNEKRRLIRARFPEDAFWPDDLKALFRDAEAGDMESQYRLGCFYMSEPLLLSEADRGKRQYVIPSSFLAPYWLRKAALQGHADAQYLLSVCYDGSWHPLMRDKRKPSRREKEFIRSDRMKWLKKAAAAGNMYAEYDLAPHLYGSRAYAPVDPTDRVTAAAEQGDARALAFGGARFFSPEIYLKNAERGNVFAMCELSNLYEYGFEDGIGTNFPKDEDKAKQWQWKAFDTALKHLEEGDGTDSDTYFRKFGVDKGVRVFSDYEETEKTALAKRILDALLNEKQDRNCSLALYAGLHMAFEEKGFIEKQDMETYLRGLVKQGVYVGALADYLLEDVRTEAEKAEGAEILRICAGMGDDESRLELAKLYLDGEGVKEDKAEAVRWLRLATGQRNLEAMFLLSVVLRTPDRPHSNLEADEWEWKAEKDGEFDSRPEYWYWWTKNELRQLLENGVRAVERAFR